MKSIYLEVSDNMRRKLDGLAALNSCENTETYVLNVLVGVVEDAMAKLGLTPKLQLHTIPPTQYINAIRAIRGATGFSLKETKGIVDAVRDGRPWLIPNEAALGALKAVGCVVSE